jgi:elongation factor P
MPIPATQLKVGMHIVHNGELHRVTSVMHVTPGNWRGMVQAKLMKVKTGTQVEHRFRSADVVDKATLEQHALQFMYRSGDEYTFMNTENYEMISLSAETLGDSAPYLQENMVIEANYYEGKVVGIEVPMTVIMRITECDPPMKGATASGGPKPAMLEGGITVKVPQHLNVGDLVKIDTRDDSFIERVSE